jgi:hypothetical protein
VIRKEFNIIVGNPLLITLQSLSTYHPWVKILVSLRKKQLEITNQILLIYTIKLDLRGHIWDKEKVANEMEGLTVYICFVLIRYRNINRKKKKPLIILD